MELTIIPQTITTRVNGMMAKGQDGDACTIQTVTFTKASG